MSRRDASRPIIRARSRYVAHLVDARTDLRTARDARLAGDRAGAALWLRSAARERRNGRELFLSDLPRPSLERARWPRRIAGVCNRCGTAGVVFVRHYGECRACVEHCGVTDHGLMCAHGYAHIPNAG